MPVLQSNMTCQNTAVCYGMDKFLQSFIKHVELICYYGLDLKFDGAAFTGNVNAAFCHALH